LAPPVAAATSFAGAEVVALPSPPLDSSPPLAADDEPASAARAPPPPPPPSPRALLLPSALVSRFTALAAANTAAPPRGVETCGILAGRPCGAGLRVTHLLVPQQSGGADSCEMLREDEVLEACLRDGLMVLGWVHTHPTQTSFLSSLDLHTHAAYQLMLPEAVALVLAPCDADAPVAVFRLTDDGLELIQRCELRGFHPHATPVVLFETSALVRWVDEGDGGFTVVDLRGASIEEGKRG
jgi:STAM-binding protein